MFNKRLTASFNVARLAEANRYESGGTSCLSYNINLFDPPLLYSPVLLSIYQLIN